MDTSERILLQGTALPQMQRVANEDSQDETWWTGEWTVEVQQAPSTRQCEDVLSAWGQESLERDYQVQQCVGGLVSPASRLIKFIPKTLCFPTTNLPHAHLYTVVFN